MNSVQVRIDYETKLQLMRDAEANKLTLSAIVLYQINKSVLAPYDPHSHDCTFFVLPGLCLASCRYLRYNIYNMCIQMPYMVMAA